MQDGKGATLKAWRERHELSQKELGDLVGASAQSVSAWESNRYRPKPSKIMALDTALGASGAIRELYGLNIDAEGLSQLREEVAELRSMLQELLRDYRPEGR